MFFFFFFLILIHVAALVTDALLRVWPDRCLLCPAYPQLQAARDPGARPVTCLPAVRWKTDRLPAVQQPEEPRQVPRARTGLLSQKLRRR